MGFTCIARQSEQQVVATITGDVDLAAYPRLEAEAAAWAGAGIDVVLDCSEVSFMDSMGLRVLVQIWQAVTDRGRSLILADPSTPVMRVLELAGVQQLFEYTHHRPGVAVESTAI
jgi:anti-anti-sigma factor